jgi:phage terminase large subunit
MPPINLKIHKRIFNDSFFPLLFDYSHRYLVLYGGAGSGKSVFAVQRTVIKALREKRKVLFIRKYATTLKDSIFDLVRSTLDQYKLLDYCTINKSTFTIELPNGSVFLFKGIDDPEKVKSITDLTDIVIEEATELSYDDFFQLDLRLRHPFAQGQEIVLMFNPVAKTNWCYIHWFLNTPPDALVVQSTYKDNRFLPQKYIDNLLQLAQYNESYYKVYALGEFATLDKLIFPYFSIANVKAELLNKPKVCGLDFGFSNDETAIVECYWDAATRTLYITDEVYEKGLVTDAIHKTILDKQFNQYPITADCADPRTIAEIRRKGINIQPAKKGKDSVLHGITWLQGIKIVVDTQCTNTINELRSYTWMKDKKTNEYFNQPIDEFNHCIDALRYATEKYATGNQVKTMSKSLLGI